MHGEHDVVVYMYAIRLRGTKLAESNADCEQRRTKRVYRRDEPVTRVADGEKSDTP